MREGTERGEGGHRAAPALTLPPAPPRLSRPGSFVLADLRRYGVDVGHAVPQPRGCLPVSVVIVSTSRGTRTILHAGGCVATLTSLSVPQVSLWRISSAGVST